jgi:uncharacterized glyoxalase superfamily protein PhnB
MLSYEDPGRAADWLVEAFGFTETGRFKDSSGRATHVNLEYGGNLLMAGWPGAGYESPRRHAESCESMRKTLDTPFVVDGVYITVDDIDAHFERAKAAGARILTEVEDNPGVGQRQYRAEDPEGHRWMFAQPD